MSVNDRLRMEFMDECMGEAAHILNAGKATKP